MIHTYSTIYQHKPLCHTPLQSSVHTLTFHDTWICHSIHQQSYRQTDLHPVRKSYTRFFLAQPSRGFPYHPKLLSANLPPSPLYSTMAMLPTATNEDKYRSCANNPEHCLLLLLQRLFLQVPYLRPSLPAFFYSVHPQADSIRNHNFDWLVPLQSSKAESDSCYILGWRRISASSVAAAAAPPSLKGKAFSAPRRISAKPDAVILILS